MLRMNRFARRLIAFFMLSVFTTASLGAVDTYWFLGRPFLGQGEFPLFSFFGLPGVDWQLVEMRLECVWGHSIHCVNW